MIAGRSAIALVILPVTIAAAVAVVVVVVVGRRRRQRAIRTRIQSVEMNEFFVSINCHPILQRRNSDYAVFPVAILRMTNQTNNTRNSVNDANR